MYGCYIPPHFSGGIGQLVRPYHYATWPGCHWYLRRFGGVHTHRGRGKARKLGLHEAARFVGSVADGGSHTPQAEKKEEARHWAEKTRRLTMTVFLGFPHLRSLHRELFIGLTSPRPVKTWDPPLTPAGQSLSLSALVCGWYESGDACFPHLIRFPLRIKRVSTSQKEIRFLETLGFNPIKGW